MPRLFEMLRESSSLSLAIGASFLIALTSLAFAGDRAPPRATLKEGGQVQRGHLYRSSWTRPTGDGECVTTAIDGLLLFGVPLHTGAGSQAVRIRFHKTQRPKGRLVIQGWTAVDSNGEPLGKAKLLPYHLVREFHKGYSRWAARVKPRVAADLYLSVFARWRDTDGCGGLQDAAWSFHLQP
jgi:hypothetical protein